MFYENSNNSQMGKRINNNDQDEYDDLKYSLDPNYDNSDRNFIFNKMKNSLNNEFLKKITAGGS